MQIRTIGGESETEQKAETVMPRSFPFASFVVTAVTPLAKLPRAARNCSCVTDIIEGRGSLFDSRSVLSSRQFALVNLLTDNSFRVSNTDKFFSEVRRLVDHELGLITPPREKQSIRLYDAIRWSLFGEGKRFRPALVFAAGRTFAGNDALLTRTAAAVEMIHTYSLIHDDLPAMDDDDLRRGRATAHKKFDEATAILAGDALQAMAFETIAGDHLLSESLRLQLISELAVAAGQMVAGQQLDLAAEGKKVDLEQIERIHRGKTGALIRFSVRAGGLIAGASRDEMCVLTDFGEKIGLLFQITDDILDVTSTSEELGKTAGKDAASRKATYPEVLGIDGARELAKTVKDNAIRSLDRLQRDGALLRSIADFVSCRNS